MVKSLEISRSATGTHSDLQQQSMEMTHWTDDWRERPPVLLIVGRQDPIFSTEDVRGLADTLMALCTYGFADHVPQVGHAGRFYRVHGVLNQYAAAPQTGSEVEE